MKHLHRRHRYDPELGRQRLRVSLVVASLVAVAGLGVPAASAQANRDAPVTKATAIHGAPGNTPGFGGSSANPEGGGVNGGNGIHAINAGSPGHNGQSAADGGEPPACNMHGGLGGDNTGTPCAD